MLTRGETKDQEIKEALFVTSLEKPQHQFNVSVLKRLVIHVTTPEETKKAIGDIDAGFKVPR
jgi:hypothetical protein